MYRSHLLQNLHPCGEGQQPQDRLCTTIPRPSEVGRNKPATQIRVADLDFLDPNDPDVDDTPEVEVELKRAIFMNISDLRKHVQNVPQRPSSRQASLAPSSSNSSSTISSVSTNTSAGSRPMRLRILSVIEGCDPRLAGHVTPITNDSYDDLVSTIKLIHEIEGDIELVRRQSGDKLSQATVADLRKDEVVDVKILPNGIDSFTLRFKRLSSFHIIFEKNKKFLRSQNVKRSKIVYGFYFLLPRPLSFIPQGYNGYNGYTTSTSTTKRFTATAPTAPHGRSATSTAATWACASAHRVQHTSLQRP